MNRRGPGLLGAAARTAVVAGTASAVSGRVQQRRQTRFAEQDAQQQAAPPQAVAPEDDLIGQLERLAELKKQGILTDAEFQAQKTRLLAE
ncbi:SHOCT domain-containing protein [Streptomyces sp. ITFR-16]|uniref:SHOCT domain-containing protein n=1 Tax=Streptomyces sp. ITFR-16 TaxID=3075198 RepID=UPI0028896AF1|nr:SHOCT domain-containing protein [Streptomyces sp. ITFR-16]WNI26452.1 SHOCT domain-containing protein [Streptomyces sp. ITFR-16]